jgi:hypothetical protein
MKKLVLGLLLATVGVCATPAVAQQGRSWSDGQRDEDGRANQNQHRRHSDSHEGDRRDEQAREGPRDHDRNWNRGRHRGQQRAAWQDYNRYDYNRYEPRYGNYQANRYYRDGRYYEDRRLSNQDRIYRGSNGQYYCRRNDGTTGLIIGAVGGGLLGRVIAPNGSKTLGTILGGAGGALIGRSIGRDGVRCN